MTPSLPALIVALPFTSAALLALVPSWRFGSWGNAAAATLLFLLTCLPPWVPGAQSSLWHIGTIEAHLALLTGFIVMTTGWLSVRSVMAAQARRSLDPSGARVYHPAYQALAGALLGALLSDNLALTWFMLVMSFAAGAVLTGLPRSITATVAAWRMLLHSGVGLMLVLFGLLALCLAAPNSGSLHWSTIAASVATFHPASLDLAFLLLVFGCCVLAGLMPLHSWLVDAAAEGVAPGAIIIGALLVNVPLLIILRLRTALPVNAGLSALLLLLGMVSLLLAALILSVRMDARRVVAIAGMAQLGVVAFAFGIGGSVSTFAGVLQVTLLSLVRASLLQCDGLAPTVVSRWTSAGTGVALLILPLLTLFLIAGAAINNSPWFLVLLGGGVLSFACAFAGRLSDLGPPEASTTGAGVVDVLMLVPIWLQLAIAGILALAMPCPVVDWFNALAGAN